MKKLLLKKLNWLGNANLFLTLTHMQSIFPLRPPKNTIKTEGFLMFLGCPRREQGLNICYVDLNKLNNFYFQEIFRKPMVF